MRKIKEIYFWTDGACSGNPGPGGWGYVSINNNKLTHMGYGSNPQTTNNRMELTAILEIAREAALDLDNKYIIYSDSAYCVNLINQWMWNWVKNNWKRPKNKPVENLDLIKKLYCLFSIDFFNVEVRKVQGHSGVLENELADRLATHNFTAFFNLLKSIF